MASASLNRTYSRQQRLGLGKQTNNTLPDAAAVLTFAIVIRVEHNGDILEEHNDAQDPEDE